MVIFLKKNTIISCLFVLGLSVFPIYLFPSGRPQLAHIVFMAFAFLSLERKSANWHSGNAYLLLIILSVLILIRQSCFVVSENIDVLLPCLYIFYNVFVFIAVNNYMSNHGLSALRPAVLISILIAVLGVVTSGFSLVASEDVGYRAIGTFNNPNQLAYYSICLLGIATILFLRQGISKFEFALVFVGCVFLSVLSLSKAAMVSIIFYLVIFLRWREFKRFIPILLIFLIAVSLLLANFNIEDLKLFNRLAQIGSDGDDNMMARGYGVLFDPDIRIIFGWGEGYVERVIGHEVHSTIGNVLISYGLPGFFLFVAFLLLVFHRLFKHLGLVGAIGVMLPVMLYGLTHNGVRFSLFWIYLAVAYSSVSVPLSGRRRMMIPIDRNFSIS